MLYLGCSLGLLFRNLFGLSFFVAPVVRFGLVAAVVLLAAGPEPAAPLGLFAVALLVALLVAVELAQPVVQPGLAVAVPAAGLGLELVVAWPFPPPPVDLVVQPRPEPNQPQLQQ